MKRLLLVALTVLVTLVGMVGFSRAAADRATQSVTPVIENIQPSLDAISNAVSMLQAAVNTSTGAVSTQHPTDTAADPARDKMYYLTVTGFTGGDAITACDSGFHMASISEIQDPSSLQYADRSTSTTILEYDYTPVPHQGLRPPTNHMGWVRTGAYPLTGFPDNCNFWQSSSDQQRGTTMSLYSPILGDANPGLHASDPTTWWHKVQQMCSLPEPVWCVEDPE